MIKKTHITLKPKYNKDKSTANSKNVVHIKYNSNNNVQNSIPVIQNQIMENYDSQIVMGECCYLQNTEKRFNIFMLL
jgi:hypothetical protein